MLQTLHIENYVLIQELDITFGEGFSVITGETGAGKSILIGALGLVLGARADMKAISPNADKCVIEATFDITTYNLKNFFEENDLDYSNECIIRRELLKSGKSRMFLNDTPISAALLKSIGDRLIDIHSQHNNLLLRDNTFQLGVVDQIASDSALLDAYREAYAAHSEAAHRLRNAREASARSKADYDYLQFQYKQLEDAAIKENEIEELEQNLNIWEHAADIKSNLGESSTILNDEQGVITLLKNAEHSLTSAVKHNPSLSPLLERLSSATIELRDIADEIASEEEHIDIDEQQLIAARERIDQLYTLQQKHKAANTAELIEIRENLAAQLDGIDGSEENIAKLEKAEKAARMAMESKAAELTSARKGITGSIATKLVERLNQLGMPNARFEVEITPIECGCDGADFVSFLFSSNKQTTLQPVTQVASGGEISRLMLCIKEIVANSKNMPTLIFDEIDTGISGEVASRMGEIMRSMSHDTQIICITHLPQVAAMGCRQYKVFKFDTEHTTQTDVKQLTDDERPLEIAKMLSGSKVTDAAIENARTLLNQSN